MSELKKNDLIKARKLCNIFSIKHQIYTPSRMAGNLRLIIICHIYLEQLELDKHINTDKHKASFSDLEYQKRMKSFKLSSSMKETHFLFLFLKCQTS